MEKFWKTLNKTCARLGIKPTQRVIFVSIAEQSLRLFDCGGGEGGGGGGGACGACGKLVLARDYAISTSRRPPSNTKDSLGTPRGLHEVAERFGEGQPAGMVFKSRQATGELFSEVAGVAGVGGVAGVAGASSSRQGEQDAPPTMASLITTRILWLRGLEPGVNLGGEVDSHGRYIYIHGTNREDLIGTPQSAGCVVMRNLDIIDLHDRVREGDMVLIA